MNTSIESVDKYFRAANYLTAAQIFLQDNFLLRRPLVADDIKPRLLGHWGTGPGINFTYAYLNLLAKKHQQEILFVLGPGHGFPALQANLFLEKTLERFYPQATHSYEGIGYICKNFSWPYGFPSHSNPGTPGVILEGGELGYSLSTAYGAALDNPDLLVAVLVGDGEAETGAAAASWHINKLVHPKFHGKVLPILHLNGYKISSPTVFGRMKKHELMSLFTGYGYEPIIVSGTKIHQQMHNALETCYRKMRLAHSHSVGSRPRMPMIILKTLKGWTGVKELDGQRIEGSHRSHQVVLTEAKSDKTQRELLEKWLSSYRINELFDENTGFRNFLDDVLPSQKYRIGMNKHSYGGAPMYQPLRLPKAEKFSEDAKKPGTMGSSSMRRSGLYLEEVFRLNDENKNFRLFSPDETYSNKLDQVFKATKRAWTMNIESWDQDLAPSGRVMEMLSEQNLQGILQGYLLTGRHGIFASYEAFIQVIVSMMDQYAKFLNQADDVPWRGDIPSLNYILTSSGWRQEHNGFSHQNPGFIDDALQRQGDFVNVFLPPDGNTTLAVLEHVLGSVNGINIIVAGKTQEPRWLTPELSKKAVNSGVMVWDFASDDDPDIVLVGAGDYLVKEALAAITIIKKFDPSIRIRFVNILSLTSCGLGRSGTCLTTSGFRQIFTPDKPVIINFHGYPETIKSILFDYIHTSPQRFSIHGYKESGSTTTPFDMHVRNKTSRYDLAIVAFERLAQQSALSAKKAEEYIESCKQILLSNTAYIKQYGVDLSEIDSWEWKK